MRSNILNTYMVTQVIINKESFRIGNGHPDEETLKLQVSIVFSIFKKLKVG